jgi:hypothetical protein
MCNAYRADMVQFFVFHMPDKLAQCRLDFIVLNYSTKHVNCSRVLILIFLAE